MAETLTLCADDRDMLLFIAKCIGENKAAPNYSAIKSSKFHSEKTIMHLRKNGFLSYSYTKNNGFVLTKKGWEAVNEIKNPPKKIVLRSADDLCTDFLKATYRNDYKEMKGYLDNHLQFQEKSKACVLLELAFSIAVSAQKKSAAKLIISHGSYAELSPKDFEYIASKFDASQFYNKLKI